MPDKGLDRAMELSLEHYRPLIEKSVKPCRHCGEWFFSPNLNVFYCSPKCSREGNLENKRKWWRNNAA